VEAELVVRDRRGGPILGTGSKKYLGTGTRYFFQKIFKKKIQNFKKKFFKKFFFQKVPRYQYGTLQDI